MKLGTDVPAKEVVLGWEMIHSPMDFVRISSPVPVGKDFLPALRSVLPPTTLGDHLRKQSYKEEKRIEMWDRAR